MDGAETGGLEGAVALLRQERIRQRRSVASVAAASGRSRRWLSLVESGRLDPSAGSLLAVAGSLGMSVAFSAAPDPLPLAPAGPRTAAPAGPRAAAAFLAARAAVAGEGRVTRAEGGFAASLPGGARAGSDADGAAWLESGGGRLTADLGDPFAFAGFMHACDMASAGREGSESLLDFADALAMSRDLRIEASAGSFERAAAGEGAFDPVRAARALAAGAFREGVRAARAWLDGRGRAVTERASLARWHGHAACRRPSFPSASGSWNRVACWSGVVEASAVAPGLIGSVKEAGMDPSSGGRGPVTAFHDGPFGGSAAPLFVFRPHGPEAGRLAGRVAAVAFCASGDLVRLVKARPSRGQGVPRMWRELPALAAAAAAQAGGGTG